MLPPQFVKRCTTDWVYEGDCVAPDALNYFNKGDAFYELEGWIAAHDRYGFNARGLQSEGSGKIIIKDMNKVIKGDYVLNNGKEFGRSWPENYWKKLNLIWHNSQERTLPYPASSTLTNTTYNFWIRLDEYPESRATIFERRRNSVQHNNLDLVWRDDDYGECTHMNPIYANNTNLTLNILSDGRLEIVQNGESTTLTGGKVNLGEWAMLTMVGASEKNISFYINGQEVGNLPTKLWFGYFPPTDCRYRAYTESYVASNGEFGYTRPEGWLFPHVQRLIIGGWNGALDEITFYRKNLSASEVAVLYESQRREIKKIDIAQGVLSPVVSPMAVEVSAQGGDVGVDLTIAESIEWVAESSESWIKCIENTGAGSKTIQIRVSPNDTTVYRSGLLMVAGKTVEIGQEGQLAEVEYEGGIMEGEGGYGFIHVDVDEGVSWTAVSDASWLYLEETEGVGSASIMVVADPCSSKTSARTATVQIGGQIVYITQRSFPLALNVDMLSYKVGGGVGEVQVTTQQDANWGVVVTEPWIKVVGSLYGVGSKKLYFTVEENLSGLARNAEIIVAGAVLQIYQNGKHSISAFVVGSGSVRGCGQYETGEQIMVSAEAASGFTFSHWNGDADGYNASITITVDEDKEIVANFIPDQAAQKITADKAGEAGLYTRDQIHALEMGNLVFDVDASGTARVGVQLMETSDLTDPNSWKPATLNGNPDVGQDGTVGLQVKAEGNAKFFKVVMPEKQ